jgi:hypothetical protein
MPKKSRLECSDAPVGNVGLNETEHLLRRLGRLDEYTVVDLEQAKELEDFTGLRRDLIDTGIHPSASVLPHRKNEVPYSPTDTDDKVDLGLRRYVEVASGAGGALEADLLLLL